MVDEVQAEELPVIGYRFDVVAEYRSASVVIHHSGMGDLYVRDDDGSRTSTVIALSDDQARRLGAVLAGAYFRPAAAARPLRNIGTGSGASDGRPPRAQEGEPPYGERRCRLTS